MKITVQAPKDDICRKKKELLQQLVNELPKVYDNYLQIVSDEFIFCF